MNRSAFQYGAAADRSALTVSRRDFDMYSKKSAREAYPAQHTQLCHRSQSDIGFVCTAEPGG